jgi:dynein heavy chain
MLTAMRQEVTRKHAGAGEGWALDDMVYRTEVTAFEQAKQVKNGPAEAEGGVYVHGLFMDGAAWNSGEKETPACIAESEPKKMFASLPVLLVTAVPKKVEEKYRKEVYGELGPYECPVYKYPARTDRYFVFFVSLRPGDPVEGPAPSHWGLRGLALLCSTE